MYDELATYIRATFKTSGELSAWLNGFVWPAYKADEKAAKEALRRERRLADKLAFEQARTTELARRAELRAADKAALEQARTIELAKRSEARRVAKQADAVPNKRFCDLDGSPLSDRQVVMRADGGHPVKEIETGRIMSYRAEGKNRGRWVEVTKTS